MWRISPALLFDDSHRSDLSRLSVFVSCFHAGGAFTSPVLVRPLCYTSKMVKLTMIARVTDGLPLSEGLDDGRDLKDADFYKQQAKQLFKNLSKGQHEASRMSIETGPYLFQYPFTIFLIHSFFFGSVVFLVWKEVPSFRILNY